MDPNPEELEMNPRLLMLVPVLAALSLQAGCQTVDGITKVRIGTELATTFALAEMDATKKEAEGVKEIAIFVKDVVDGDGAIDGTKIKVEVTRQINKKFQGAKRAVLTSLANAVTSQILASLEKQIALSQADGEAQVIATVRAAAEGVEAGATVYISALEP